MAHTTSPTGMPARSGLARRLRGGAAATGSGGTICASTICMNCRLLFRSAALLGLALWLILPAAELHAQPTGIDVELERVASGLDFPTTVVQPADGTGRFFILEQPGRIRVIQDGELLPEPFLDLSDRVSCCNEQGLIGLAFHPDFAANGELFVHYTDLAGNTQIARYRVSGDPNRADPGSAEPLLSLGQPFDNHNGGQLAFGPDGLLYIGLGDGGSGGDPMDNGQDVTTLLGKILRIDVDRTDPGLAYGVPPDNPRISDDPAARREIWAYGLRNPWRFSFDRATGDLFIGDVGEDQREEIDRAPAGQGGQNFGWRLKEGTLCHEPSTGCEREGLVDPILEYSHDEGCSVTGGFRYRGSASPALAGVYLYGDFCSGRLWGATLDGAGVWRTTVLDDTGLQISSFGEDAGAELYLTHYEAAPNGALYRIRATGAGDDGGGDDGGGDDDGGGGDDDGGGDDGGGDDDGGGGGGGGDGDGDPAPPPGEFLTDPRVPGFRFKVAITAGGEPQPVRLEPDCVPETACISGAVPGRPELLLRVVGPRPNGRLWPVLVRFSPSTVEVWLEQTATGVVRYYRLDGAAPGDSRLAEGVDRSGFPVPP